MPRGKRVDIEARIKAAQEQVAKTKDRHDWACAELKGLLAKRDEMRKDELWEAVAKSERSYEEVLAWVKGAKARG